MVSDYNFRILNVKLLMVDADCVVPISHARSLYSLLGVYISLSTCCTLGIADQVRNDGLGLGNC